MRAISTPAGTTVISAATNNAADLGTAANNAAEIMAEAVPAVPPAPGAGSSAAAGLPGAAVPVPVPAPGVAPPGVAPPGVAPSGVPGPVPDAARPAPGLPAQPPLQHQIGPHVQRLAAAAPGEHILVLKVAPENLGPVTVRAHIGAEGLRIELFAVGEAGRDAVRAVLGDLRRDLAGTGLPGSLTLSQQDRPSGQPGDSAEDSGSDARHGPSGDGGGRQALEDRQGAHRGKPAAGLAAGPAAAWPHPAHPSLPGLTGIDILA